MVCCYLYTTEYLLVNTEDCKDMAHAHLRIAVQLLLDKFHACYNATFLPFFSSFAQVYEVGLFTESLYYFYSY